MVRSEWSCIFPLRISCSIALANRDPSIFAGGDSWALVRLFEPWNNPRRFGSMASICFVIVGQRAVKWVLSWPKLCRSVTAPLSRIWVVKTAVVSRPLLVPRARPIRHRIVSAWSFTDPKNSRNDTCFPRIPPQRSGACRWLSGRERV